MTETTQLRETAPKTMEAGVNLAQYSTEALMTWLENNRKSSMEEWGQFVWESNKQTETTEQKWLPSEEYKIWQAVQAYVSSLSGSDKEPIFPSSNNAVLTQSVKMSDNGLEESVYTVVRNKRA